LDINAYDIRIVKPRIKIKLLQPVIMDTS
jgi:hypothetical protein